MTSRAALVLADDGLIEQLQSGDSITGLEGVKDALSLMLRQNNAIVRMLIGLCISADADSTAAGLSDTDIEDFVEEITP